MDSEFSPNQQEITDLLNAWSQGDSEAGNRVFYLLYPELKKIAGSRLSREKAGFDLQTKELIHEMYLKMINQKNSWANRKHFFGIASQIIRRVILDHIRSISRKKRGGHAEKVGLDHVQGVNNFKTDWLALDQALENFAKKDPLTAKICELHYFLGFSCDDIAPILGVSRASANRRLRVMRAFLKDALDTSDIDPND